MSKQAFLSVNKFFSNFASEKSALTHAYLLNCVEYNVGMIALFDRSIVSAAFALRVWKCIWSVQLPGQIFIFIDTIPDNKLFPPLQNDRRKYYE